MKKICRRIKLLSYKSWVSKEHLDSIHGSDFYVLFQDGTYVYCYSKEDLRRCLEKDHIKKIQYVFDTADRIIIKRDVLIDTDEV